ncbi:uncharacterized protein LOC128736775 [Sabethes cyaneus]|uniref:uncharacterized protein LOC128736775 n=1 Tax=Sabethes cyaneus TaxID=53552 RepID=UPI00237E727F|nr:uncharacterized protein LOC128736775 [Sabethes cyaneus]
MPASSMVNQAPPGDGILPTDWPTRMLHCRTRESPGRFRCEIDNFELCFCGFLLEPTIRTGAGLMHSSLSFYRSRSILYGWLIAGADDVECRADSNDHQLSSSISPGGLDPGSQGFARSSISSSNRTSAPRSQSWQQQQQQPQQHVVGEGKLIDNKLRDKLLSFVERRSDRAVLRRSKRDDLSSTDEINNYYAKRISDVAAMASVQGEDIPRITEVVLPASNLSDERIREENELLEHLNREPFPDSHTSPTSAGGVRKNHPGSGKKGRRRKGHKKKIKRIKPTVEHRRAGSPTVGAGSARTGQINSLLTSETKLSLNESVQQSKARGGRKHKQKQPGGGGGKRTSQTSSPAREGPGESQTLAKSSDRRGLEKWDRKAGRDLIVLKSDDIYDKNMQMAVQKDATEDETILLADVVDSWSSSSSSQQPTEQQLERPGRNEPPPPPAGYREAPKERRQKAQKKQQNQLKRYKKGDQLLSPASNILTLQQLPPAPATDPSAAVSSVTVVSSAEDMHRTEAVSLQRVIIAGDLSCMKDDFIPAPAIPNADIKYLRNDLYGLEHSFLEAEYHCRVGYERRQPGPAGRSENNDSNLICRKSRWIGKRPSCVRIKPAATVTATSGSDGTSPLPGGTTQQHGNKLCGRQHNCQQACHMRKDNDSRVCSCFKGFKMVDGRCVDINECTEYGEDICEYGCSNTVGSFICKCPKGLRVTDNNKCMDVNECLLRNGHGPCQDTCINTWSGYRCSCAGLPGTRLAQDGHSCEDIDECTVNNGGCSHTCLNTLGRAFCVCPAGYMLDDDWKTCIDIDECSNQKSIRQEFRCQGSCINTVGSYRCLEPEDELDARDGPGLPVGSQLLLLPKQSDELDDGSDDTLCPSGYYFNTTMGDCQDTNECSSDNAGCQHHCINSDGSYYCSCKYGFKLDPDKHGCLVLNDSLKLADVACPPLFPPRHGYLECSRPIDEISDGPNGGRLKIINRPGSQCILKCPTGYRLEGKYSKICGTTGEWIGDESGSCIRFPQPRLTCPTSVNVELHPNETDTTAVKLRRPKTDVSWERDIVAEPLWAKKDTLLLPLGSINISYTAKHPVSKLTTSCTFAVHVIAGRPPTVDFCPDTQIYTIEGRHESVKATWEEPIFSDNVGVVTITKSNSPGTDFGAGSHLITYEAHDGAEWSSKCVFKIVVNVSKRKDVQHYQLPILYNRFYF